MALRQPPARPRHRYPAVVRLAVGDMVVYASHGAGRVAAREIRVVLGKRQEVIVLALAGGLSVELPMERADELLRPLVSEADISRVQKPLGADQAVSRDSWLRLDGLRVVPTLSGLLMVL